MSRLDGASEPSKRRRAEVEPSTCHPDGTRGSRDLRGILTNHGPGSTLDKVEPGESSSEEEMAERVPFDPASPPRSLPDEALGPSVHSTPPHQSTGLCTTPNHKRKIETVSEPPFPHMSSNIPLQEVAQPLRVSTPLYRPVEQAHSQAQTIATPQSIPPQSSQSYGPQGSGEHNLHHAHPSQAGAQNVHMETSPYQASLSTVAPTRPINHSSAQSQPLNPPYPSSQQQITCPGAPMESTTDPSQPPNADSHRTSGQHQFIQEQPQDQLAALRQIAPGQHLATGSYLAQSAQRRGTLEPTAEPSVLYPQPVQASSGPNQHFQEQPQSQPCVYQPPAQDPSAPRSHPLAQPPTEASKPYSQPLQATARVAAVHDQHVQSQQLGQSCTNHYPTYPSAGQPHHLNPPSHSLPQRGHASTFYSQRLHGNTHGASAQNQCLRQQPVTQSVANQPPMDRSSAPPLQRGTPQGASPPLQTDVFEATVQSQYPPEHSSNQPHAYQPGMHPNPQASMPQHEAQRAHPWPHTGLDGGQRPGLGGPEAGAHVGTPLYRDAYNGASSQPDSAYPSTTESNVVQSTELGPVQSGMEGIERQGRMGRGKPEGLMKRSSLRERLQRLSSSPSNKHRSHFVSDVRPGAAPQLSGGS